VKKIIVFILVLSLALCLCACSRASQIPSLAEIAENGAEWGGEQIQQVQGCTLADLEKAWGKADGELSGMYGYFWKVNDTVLVYALYYPENAEIERITVRDLQDGDNTAGTGTTSIEQQTTPDLGVTDIPPFSYEEVLQTWGKDDPGVKTNGFQNTSKTVISTSLQAIELAKNECTIEYDTTDVSYDSAASIWQVVFYKANTAGGGQTVYMDSDGITCLIVYGE